VTGSGVGAYMIIPGVGYETSSGGPFFRGLAAPFAQVSILNAYIHLS